MVTINLFDELGEKPRMNLDQDARAKQVSPEDIESRQTSNLDPVARIFVSRKKVTV